MWQPCKKPHTRRSTSRTEAPPRDEQPGRQGLRRRQGSFFKVQQPEWRRGKPPPGQTYVSIPRCSSLDEGWMSHVRSAECRVPSAECRVQNQEGSQLPTVLPYCVVRSTKRARNADTSTVKLPHPAFECHNCRVTCDFQKAARAVAGAPPPPPLATPHQPLRAHLLLMRLSVPQSCSPATSWPSLPSGNGSTSPVRHLISVLLYRTVRLLYHTVRLL
jgi:hypothetical protein